MLRNVVVRVRLTLLGSLVPLLAGLVHLGATQAFPVERQVQTIPLTGRVAARDAELSGLVWHGDDLLLLPQYPRRMDPTIPDGALIAFGRAEIEAYLDGAGPVPTPRPVPLNAHGLADQIEGFDGFEAIAIAGDDVYLSVEVTFEDREPVTSHGYLVRGHFDATGGIELVDQPPVRIDPQAAVPNLAYEALAVIGDEVYLFYEANGLVNAQPHAEVFDRSLRRRRVLPMESIEFRITDLTDVDEGGRVWATNFMWEGASWDAGPCALTARFGAGPSHQSSRTVERLVELEVTEEGVHPTDRAPIQLQLLEEGSRNWEGIVRLPGRGFLIVTDKFPSTILGFVEAP